MSGKNSAKKKKIFFKKIIFAVLVFVFVFGAYGVFKPLPEGLNFEGNEFYLPPSSVSFLSDKTYWGGDGQRHSEQEIFDEIIKTIREADSYILADMFLFNDFLGRETKVLRKLSSELAGEFIKKKKEKPEMVVTVITDPINTVYGGPELENFRKMREAGISVVFTDLNEIRDTNPAYSSFWKVFAGWFGNSGKRGSLPNPFDYKAERVPLRSYLALPNFKANHRKLLVADKKANGERKMVSIITSANPHDASSFHDNAALKIENGIWKDIIKSENAIAAFSGAGLFVPPPKVIEPSLLPSGKNTVKVQLLTENKIKKKLLEIVNNSSNGDSIDMAMFYLSDRDVLKALLVAAGREVKIRLALDPNKDAFGFKKDGVPNRPTADELVKKSDGRIKIRWCDTHGEQCHSKFILIKNKDGYFLLLGSANLTRRNIGGYNLETNALVESKELIPALAEAYGYMEEIWNNKNGRFYTSDYEKYKEKSILKYLEYRFKEATGVSSF